MGKGEKLVEDFIFVFRKDLPSDLQSSLPDHIEGMRVSRTFKMMNCGNGKEDRKELQRELNNLLPKN